MDSEQRQAEQVEIFSAQPAAGRICLVKALHELVLVEAREQKPQKQTAGSWRVKTRCPSKCCCRSSCEHTDTPTYIYIYIYTYMYARPPLRCNLCVTALTTVQTARQSGVCFTAEALECYWVHTRTLSIWTSCIGVLDMWLHWQESRVSTRHKFKSPIAMPGRVFGPRMSCKSCLITVLWQSCANMVPCLVKMNSYWKRETHLKETLKTDCPWKVQPWKS